MKKFIVNNKTYSFDLKGVTKYLSDRSEFNKPYYEWRKFVEHRMLYFFFKMFPNTYLQGRSEEKYSEMLSFIEKKDYDNIMKNFSKYYGGIRIDIISFQDEYLCL